MSISSGKDTFIVCRNSQGMEFRATPLRLARYTVVFEVYNPYSILQLGEVLSDFKMIMNDRMVYSGRAVVSNLVNTGILLVCECSLEESWLDVDVFTSSYQKSNIKNEFVEFLRDWENIHQIKDELKVAVADLQTFLMDIRRWLEQVELSIRSEPYGDRLQMEKDAVQELKALMAPAIRVLFDRFEATVSNVPTELLAIHRSYSKRQLHPLVLCSPFVYRAFHKPLGYAGDYEMVNMMLRDPHEGGSLFAKILNTFFLSSPPCLAHRNRIQYLKRKLTDETSRVTGEKRATRILSMGCGPAREVQAFINEEEGSDQARFFLMDFNDETLESTQRILEDLKKTKNRKTEIHMIKKSVNVILKESFKPTANPEERDYDFIYCAGLFDYLEDRICKRLMEYFYGLLAPGGLLLATNVTPNNPIRNILESLLEWPMVYRNESQMADIKPGTAGESSLNIYTEETGVNIFIEVRKPK
ncbi:MAG TPA: methyltransferase domain-containing protein [bacterium]|jgi:extracellular factor (EF) 3-hydroxypalmitic acid methyl ester biosynthesis protein|nr:methyltransferase domain-containing protein [bacterium]